MVGGEKEESQRVKDDLQVWGPATGRMEVPLTEMGRTDGDGDLTLDLRRLTGPSGMQEEVLRGQLGKGSRGEVQHPEDLDNRDTSPWAL